MAPSNVCLFPNTLGGSFRPSYIFRKKGARNHKSSISVKGVRFAVFTINAFFTRLKCVSFVMTVYYHRQSLHYLWLSFLSVDMAKVTDTHTHTHLHRHTNGISKSKFNEQP